jgi:hypothetical protein
MEHAATLLPSVPATGSLLPTPVVFLTGRSLWYQTAFCGWSLIRQSASAFSFRIYDDGTLDGTCRDRLQRLFPTATIEPAAETTARLNQHLPRSKFPYLRRRREDYLPLRKLTDVHVGQTGWRLFLDSDMLFFRTPTQLLNWLQAPQQPCTMQDVCNAYGYSDGLMRELAGRAVPDRINSGVCGLRSESLDWERLEHWCRVLEDREGTHYFLEQALMAVLLANIPHDQASGEYVVKPSRAEVEHPTQILHHYVSESKAWYFRQGWRHISRVAVE